MKLVKELSFRCFILLVMLSLAFVAYDMSKPVLLNEEEISSQDVAQCIVLSFKAVFDTQGNGVSDLPNKDYNFTLNIFLPIIVYIASIGGFTYLLIEDFKILKTFSHQNKFARYLWTLWIIILIGLILIPIFFGLQLLMKGFVLAVIATAVFLIVVGILYRLTYIAKK
jgi:hypothetical protein